MVRLGVFVELLGTKDFGRLAEPEGNQGGWIITPEL